MDRYHGGNLFDYIKENDGIKDEREIYSLTAQIGQAILDMHLTKGMANRIAHHDLKPENIFLKDYQKGTIAGLYVGDFGFATVDLKEPRTSEKESPFQLPTNHTIQRSRILEDRYHRRLNCGTPFYAAPSCSSAAGCGPEADWFSFATILYVSIEVGYPYGSDYARTLNAQTVREIKRPFGVAKPFVMASLHKFCMEIWALVLKVRESGDSDSLDEFVKNHEFFQTAVTEYSSITSQDKHAHREECVPPTCSLL